MSAEKESVSKIYIADKKVKGMRTLPHTTPLGAEILEISFEDGSVREMTKRRFEVVQTSKPSDATTERSVITEAAAHHILATFHEFGIKLIDVNHLLDTITNSINSSYANASDKLWGVPFYGEQDLNQIKRVLENGKENNNGSASAGSGTSA